MIEINRKDKDIKSYYDVYHIFKEVRENVSILRHERYFLKDWIPRVKNATEVKNALDGIISKWNKAEKRSVNLKP